jgi:peptide/nickel transport system permease protein
VISILVISLMVFTLVRIGGDPTEAFVPEEATEATVELIRARLGLDKPFYQQYWIFFKDMVRGDLGESKVTKEPVTGKLLERLPATLSLAGISMGIALVIALPLGVLSAVYRDTPIDRLAKILAFLGQSTPQFWMAIMLMVLFGVILQVLPVAGRGGPSTYVLPGITMGWFVVAGVVRLTRSSMLDVLDSDYITMARAKGLSERIVVWKHALRNAMIPVLTFSGLILGGFMNGSVVVEVVFAWPGLGRLALDAVVSRDFPVVQGMVMMVGAFYIVINLLVDLLYAAIDPRIKYT